MIEVQYLCERAVDRCGGEQILVMANSDVHVFLSPTCWVIGPAHVYRPGSLSGDDPSF